MKKLMSVLLAVAMVITLSSGMLVSASGDWIIAPYWNYMNSAEVDVNFSGNSGKATASVTRVFGVTTKLEATLTVYKQNGNKWVYVDSVSDSSARSLGLELSFNAESGETYKAVLDVTAYGSSGSETDTFEKEKTCP